MLLRGVNDDANTLAELCERLVDLRVTPYYLHQLDPVAGASHFRVDESRGLEIVRELQRRLPGFAVPPLRPRSPRRDRKDPRGSLDRRDAVAHEEPGARPLDDQ